MSCAAHRRAGAGESGQAFVLLVGALLAVATGGLAIGWLLTGLAAADGRQRAADLAALAGARSLVETSGDGIGAADVAAARDVATETARRNGASDIEIVMPGSGPGIAAVASPPSRVTVVVRDAVTLLGARIGGQASAEAAAAGAAALPGDGEYRGPVATRQGKPMRPDVALAFDRLERAARGAGHRLLITSALRTAAEQALLFAANPDPKWVARPGRSLHRLGTELDLGPISAYGWLGANAGRFGFVKRYSWEPWHFGFGPSPGSASVGFRRTGAAGGAAGLPVGVGPGAGGTLPPWVPGAYAPVIRAAAQRWGVGAALLAAQLRQESGFRPRAVSHAGARGIAQFMPATARRYGLRNAFDPHAAIDAQAHLMHDLLRRFGSVPLALAAYNAGPGPVAACGCVPPFAETQAYVRRIVALARGEGLYGTSALVRLVR